jgi:hypothetical protein
MRRNLSQYENSEVEDSRAFENELESWRGAAWHVRRSKMFVRQCYIAVYY